MRRAAGFRLRTEHLTTFTYSAPVRSSYNEVRQVPLTTVHQTALEGRIHTTPSVPQYSYWDYWGTRVVAFNIDGTHDRLVVHGISLVDTEPAPAVPQATWEQVAALGDRFAELLAPSPHTEVDERLRQETAALRASTPTATVRRVVAWVHDSLDYVRGVTHVHTSAAEAYAAGRGVCQDFAHLTIATLRQLGIPARYVSGYLHPERQPAVGSESTGESHAWAEAWTGDWWGLDPTNSAEVGPSHVLVARGRDYADVAPVRGVYAGAAEHTTSVRVTVTRTA